MKTDRITLFLLAAVLTSCQQDAPTRQSHDVDLGVVFETRPFRRTIHAKNATGRAWEILSTATSCGCVGVVRAPDRVAPGESLAIEIEVNPDGRFGRQRQTVIARLAGGGSIRWSVAGVFAARPYLASDRLRIELDRGAELFTGTLVVYSARSHGALEVRRGSGRSLDVGVGELEDLGAGAVGGMVRRKIRVRGVLPRTERAAQFAVSLKFANVETPLTGRIAVARQAEFACSPRAVLLPAALPVGRSLRVAYRCAEGLSVTGVVVEGGGGATTDSAPALAVRVGRDHLEISRRAGATSLTAGTGELAVRLSDGTTARLPLCITVDGAE